MTTMLGSLALCFLLSAQSADFRPGDKVVFFDDYSDMDPEAAPSHWKVRGGVARLGPNRHLILQNYGRLYPNLKALPADFTLETEITPQAKQTGYLTWRFEQAGSGFGVKALFDTGQIRTIAEQYAGGSKELARGQAPFEPGKPVRIAIWFQKGRLRAYVNEQRTIDLNQLESASGALPHLVFQTSDGPVLEFTQVRLAESTPDISKTLFDTGRYVTQAIQFDVDSDRLRPESANVIQLVAGALQQRADLKVRIEGHTDSTGTPEKNLDLSQRRAESVKRALVSRGIAADRLTTEGLGQTKPVSPNETPQGRAENRRVEFVKL